ncbi:MAG TPA: hypothetical protein VFB99_07745, partial [Vicinamibacterales bacterium]|nr:hypothetical protein [Vicinamibacterales bacterium]
MRWSATLVTALALGLQACTAEAPEPSAPASAELVPAEHDAKVALGQRHGTAVELYAALKARGNGGTPLSLDDMPDWSGFWQRVGKPFFDPAQPEGVLTTAKLTPAAAEELARRRERSAQGIEYDPISDCSPPGFPRWLVIPFLREFTVTPQQTYLFSETVNNLRRVYTDGREH